MSLLGLILFGPHAEAARKRYRQYLEEQPAAVAARAAYLGSISDLELLKMFVWAVYFVVFVVYMDQCGDLMLIAEAFLLRWWWRKVRE